MINVTDSVNKVIKKAGQIAYKYSCNEIGTEHILYGLTAVENCIASRILNEFGVNSSNLEQVFMQTYQINYSRATRELNLTPRSYEIVKNAEQISYQLSTNYVGTEHLLLGLLLMDGCLANQILAQVFSINLNALKTKVALTLRLITEQDISNIKNNQNNKDNNPNYQYQAQQQNTVENEGLSEDLLQMGIDLTEKAKRGKIDPIIGRDEEIERMIEILCRKTKRNPVLVGEAGVGKSAIVEGLAQRIVNNQVPELLKGKTIYSLEVGSLMAGTKFRGAMEEKLKKLIDYLKENPNVILFVDEMHTIMTAGSKEGEVGPAEMLKPYLSRGELQTIGATTNSEYRKFIEKDSALERRFQPLMVNPPSIKDSILILSGLKHSFEKYHGVEINDSAIVSAVSLSDRYITDRNLPDKAIDLIDEACSKAKVNASKNGALNKAIITEVQIADVVSAWTKIPVQRLTEAESEKLKDLEEVLKKRIIGQNEAISIVSKAVRRARIGLKDVNRPIGSFIFLGQTGVGKTELCKALAEALFDNENQIIRFDMSEYMEPHSVAKLIGAPAGYVGYEEAGLLTEQVRKKPYSIVLFDEIEKAHQDVFNVLLQILEDGRLTDSKGKVVSFKNTIIIFTSNCGVSELKNTRAVLGFNDNFNNESKKNNEVLMNALKRKFKPEFLNRIDNIIIFNSLTHDDLARITANMIKNLNIKLQNMGLSARISADALRFIVENGSNVEYGARPLRRFITTNIEDKITEDYLNGTTKNKHTILIDAVNNNLTFTYE